VTLFRRIIDFVNKFFQLVKKKKIGKTLFLIKKKLWISCIPEVFWWNHSPKRRNFFGVVLIFSGRSLIIQIKKKKKALLIYPRTSASLCGSINQIFVNLYIFLWSHWILSVPIDFKPVVRLGIKTITVVLKVSAYIITACPVNNVCLNLHNCCYIAKKQTLIPIGYCRDARN